MVSDYGSPCGLRFCWKDWEIFNYERVWFITLIFGIFHFFRSCRVICFVRFFSCKTLVSNIVFHVPTELKLVITLFKGRSKYLFLSKLSTNCRFSKNKILNYTIWPAFFSQIFREAHIVCVKKGRWLFWNNHQLPLNDSCKVSIITIKLTILYHYISNTWELSKCCILSFKKSEHVQK